MQATNAMGLACVEHILWLRRMLQPYNLSMCGSLNRTCIKVGSLLDIRAKIPWQVFDALVPRTCAELKTIPRNMIGCLGENCFHKFSSPAETAPWSLLGQCPRAWWVQNNLNDQGPRLLEVKPQMTHDFLQKEGTKATMISTNRTSTDDTVSDHYPETVAGTKKQMRLARPKVHMLVRLEDMWIVKIVQFKVTD